MENELLTKISALPAELKQKLSDEKFLADLDQLEESYGIKSISLIVSILSNELKLQELAKKLSTNYGFNDFLSQEISQKIEKQLKNIGWQSTSPISQVIKTTPASDLIFSKEDEDEVKRYTWSQNQNNNSVDYQKLALGIIEKIGIKLDLSLKDRLLQVVLHRLKDIRDDLETLDSLTKSIANGGLGFEQLEAEKLLKIIKSESGLIDFFTSDGSNKLSAIQPQSGVKVVDFLSQATKSTYESADSFQNSTQNSVPNFVSNSVPVKTQDQIINNQSSVVKETTKVPTIDEEDGLPIIKMPEKNLPQPVSDFLPQTEELAEEAEEIVSIISDIDLDDSSLNTNQKTELAKKLPIESKNVKINNSSDVDLPPPMPRPYVGNQDIPESVLNSKNIGRPNLDDIKFEKKSFGPLEELEQMTLIEFRRLSADPNNAVKKIEEKINLLYDRGVSERAKGIVAWSKSEVMRFYRNLIQLSLNSGQPIDLIVKERLLSGKPTLSLDEIEAVSQLNNKLRY